MLKEIRPAIVLLLGLAAITGVIYPLGMTASPRSPPCIRSPRMLDIALLALGLGFFVLSVGYAYACERL